MEALKTIDDQAFVKLHFDIRLKDGSIAESTRQGQPEWIKLGQGLMPPKFESELEGLAVGDKKKIMLLADEAFGQPMPTLVFQVPMHKFNKMEEPLEEGMIISFDQADGQPRPGIVREIGEDEVTIDFNHPLAGHVVLFDLEVLEISDAVPA